MHFSVGYAAAPPARPGLGRHRRLCRVDPAAPVEASSEATSSGSSVAVPSLTASAGGRILGAFALYGSSVTAPPTMTKRWLASTSGPLVMSSLGADEVLTTTGATGARTASGSSGSWAGQLIALKPATPQTVTRYGFTGHENAPSLELDGSNNILKRTVSFVGGAIVTRAQATASASDVWSYPNLHRDVSATANGTKTGSTFTYDPFGQPLSGLPSNTSSNLSYGWTGSHQKLTEHQGSLATIEMGARQYVPGLGRFLSVDPVEGGCANDYTFAYGDPVNHPDLDGKGLGCTLKAIGGVLLGAAAIGLAIAGFPAAAIGLAAGGAVLSVWATVDAYNGKDKYGFALGIVGSALSLYGLVASAAALALVSGELAGYLNAVGIGLSGIGVAMSAPTAKKC